MTRAMVEAERLLEDLGLKQVPVIPKTICEAMSSPNYQITIDEKPMDSEGFHGISMGNANGAVILINAIISNQHRKRFTAAHEIGHVHLHIQTKKQSQFECTATDISSNSSQNNDFEKEANEFASSLLMPASIISPDIYKNDLSWALIENIQKRCDVSLEAAARRVIALSKEACCLITHKEHEMWTPVKSTSFNAYLSKQPFPNHLHTNVDTDGIDKLPDDMDECDFDDWEFPDNAHTGQLFYSSIHNSAFNRTMTLLLHEEDTINDEDHEDEPRFS